MTNRKKLTLRLPLRMSYANIHKPGSAWDSARCAQEDYQRRPYSIQPLWSKRLAYPPFQTSCLNRMAQTCHKHSQKLYKHSQIVQNGYINITANIASLSESYLCCLFPRIEILPQKNDPFNRTHIRSPAIYEIAAPVSRKPISLDNGSAWRLAKASWQVPRQAATANSGCQPC